MSQHDLEDALHRLAVGVTPPVVPVADDLERGRRRRRRTRLSVAGGAALAVAVIGLGTAVVPDLVSAGGDPTPAPEAGLGLELGTRVLMERGAAKLLGGITEFGRLLRGAGTRSHAEGARD